MLSLFLYRLHIYEVSSTGTKTRRLTPSTGLYGVLERPFLIYNTAGIIVPDFRSAGPRMRLDYQGKPTIIYRGFRVLVTVFYSKLFDNSTIVLVLMYTFAIMAIDI